ncbi:hypothetical protein DFH06DRAFT_1131607 [Mycena polygramma]|nr:hypothetical protein DFH06DRAFT_1131607 [Mycena polygramma]
MRRDGEGREEEEGGCMEGTGGRGRGSVWRKRLGLAGPRERKRPGLRGPRERKRLGLAGPGERKRPGLRGPRERKRLGLAGPRERKRPGLRGPRERKRLGLAGPGERKRPGLRGPRGRKRLGLAGPGGKKAPRSSRTQGKKALRSCRTRGKKAPRSSRTRGTGREGREEGEGKRKGRRQRKGERADERLARRARRRTRVGEEATMGRQWWWWCGRKSDVALRLFGPRTDLSHDHAHIPSVNAPATTFSLARRRLTTARYKKRRPSGHVTFDRSRPALVPVPPPTPLCRAPLTTCEAATSPGTRGPNPSLTPTCTTPWSISPRNRCVDTTIALSTFTPTTDFWGTNSRTLTTARSITRRLRGGTALSLYSQKGYMKLTITISSAGYTAQRTAEDAQTHDNRAELDDYLTHTFCIPKSPPCKLARASPANDAPFNAVAGPSNDPSANGSGEDLDDNGRGEDLDRGWRHPCWWCFSDVPDQLAFITRDKLTIDRALKMGLRVSFRSQFKDAVLRIREILHLNPGDRPLHVLQDGDVLENCDLAYAAYLKRESKGTVFCCCKDINAVGAYVELLAGLA